MRVSVGSAAAHPSFKISSLFVSFARLPRQPSSVHFGMQVSLDERTNGRCCTLDCSSSFHSPPPCNGTLLSWDWPHYRDCRWPPLLLFRCFREQLLSPCSLATSSQGLSASVANNSQPASQQVVRPIRIGFISCHTAPKRNGNGDARYK